MMPGILLQPFSSRDSKTRFKDTISRGVPVDDLRGKVGSDVMSILEKEGSTLKAWGLAYGGKGPNKRIWLELLPGDQVFFYGNKRFLYQAEIIAKINDSDLAKKWWGQSSDGRPWELIFFIKNGKEINFEWRPEQLGFSPEYIIQGARYFRSGTEKAEIFFRNVGYVDYGAKSSSFETTPEDISSEESEDIDEFISKYKQPMSAEEADRILQQMADDLLNTPVDRKQKVSYSLSRNSTIARIVKARDNFTCQICGELGFLKENGERYIEAHHIDELATNRIDNPHRMISLCPTCHRVVHYGKKEELQKRNEMK